VVYIGKLTVSFNNLMYVFSVVARFLSPCFFTSGLLPVRRFLPRYDMVNIGKAQTEHEVKITDFGPSPWAIVVKGGSADRS